MSADLYTTESGFSRGPRGQPFPAPPARQEAITLAGLERISLAEPRPITLAELNGI